jgi:hypothetical protein
MVEALPSDSQLKSLLSLFTRLRVTGGEVGQVSKDAQKKDDLTALVSKDSPEKNALPVLTEIVEESPSDGLLQPNKRHFNDTY